MHHQKGRVDPQSLDGQLHGIHSTSYNKHDVSAKAHKQHEVADAAKGAGYKQQRPEVIPPAEARAGCDMARESGQRPFHPERLEQWTGPGSARREGQQQRPRLPMGGQHTQVAPAVTPGRGGTSPPGAHRLSKRKGVDGP